MNEYGLPQNDSSGLPDDSSLPNHSADPVDPGTTTLSRLKRMDNPSWATLVDQHFDRVYAWCREMGSLHRFEKSSQSTFGGWLRTICQRRIADYWRRRREVPMGGTDALNMFSQLGMIRESLDPEHANQSLDDDRSDCEEPQCGSSAVIDRPSGSAILTLNPIAIVVKNINKMLTPITHKTTIRSMMRANSRHIGSVKFSSTPP